MMYLIHEVETLTPINNKAKDICKFCKDYKGCLLTSDKDFDDLVETIKSVVRHANGLYPKTKPFSLTTNRMSCIHVVVNGNSDQQVVRFYIATITGVYRNGLNMPIRYFMLNGKEVQL